MARFSTARRCYLATGKKRSEVEGVTKKQPDHGFGLYLEVFFCPSLGVIPSSGFRGVRTRLRLAHLAFSLLLVCLVNKACRGFHSRAGGPLGVTFSPVSAWVPLRVLWLPPAVQRLSELSEPRRLVRVVPRLAQGLFPD